MERRRTVGFARFARARLLALFALGFAACAPTVEETVRRMQDLNREALAEHEKGKDQAARDKLQQAVAIGRHGRLDKHPMQARTHLHLGIVYVSGLKDRELGVQEMATALRIQPDIKITKSLSSAAVRRAFVAARVEAKRPPGESPPPTSSATSAATASKPVPVASAKPPPRSTKKRTVAKASPKGRKPATKPPAKSAATALAPKPAPEPKAVDLRPAEAKPVDVKPPEVRTAEAKPAEVKAADVKPPPPSKPAEPAPPPRTTTLAAAAPPPQDREPPLPSSFPKPLACPEPPSTPDAAIEFRCAAQPGLHPSRVSLFYRAPGTEAFTEVPMTRSRKGWYVGEVPATATGGTLIQYYVEAQAPGNKTAANSGDAVSPNLLLLKTAAAEGGSDADEPAAALEEENPLEGIEKERDRATLHRRPAKAWWIALGIGTGHGWHPDRKLEFRDTKEVSTGFSRAGLLHLAPEIGYQWSDNVAFSLQSRHQFIPEEGSGDLTPGHPAHSAHAVFARAYYFIGDSNLQPFVNATAGGGDGFRLVVDPRPTDDLPRNDTIRGGPIVLGPGAGLIYHFGAHVAVALELRALAGLPLFAAVAEANLGAAFAF